MICVPYNNANDQINFSNLVKDYIIGAEVNEKILQQNISSLYSENNDAFKECLSEYIRALIILIKFQINNPIEYQVN